MYTSIYKNILDQKCPQTSKITREGVYFLHSTNGSCAIVHLDPDHQLILLASSHLVEKLKTLQFPLWVEGSGFQQGRFARLSRHGTEVHEKPSIYALRQNNLVTSTQRLRILSGQYWKLLPLHLPRSV